MSGPGSRIALLLGTIFLGACVASSAGAPSGPGQVGSGGTTGPSPGTGGGAAGASGGTTGPSLGTGGAATGGTSTNPPPGGTGGLPAAGSGGSTSSTGGSTVGAGGTTSGTTGGAGTMSADSRGGTGGGAGGPSVPGGASGTDPGIEGDGDFTAGPTYSLASDLTMKGNPQGKTFSLSLPSANSKIFTGLDTTLTAPTTFTRSINVYIPAKYKNGTPAPLMVVQDGGGTPFVLIKAALDNLTIETDPARRLPPFVAISVSSGGGDGMGSERGLEYDTMSDRYARYIDSEVLPAIESNAAIKAAFPNFSFTKDPEGRGAAGCSSGAAAAFTMAWLAPNLFHKAIAYSATLVAQQAANAPEKAMYPDGAWDYHSDLALIANTTPNLPVRIFHNANEMDNGYMNPESGKHNWLMANQRTAAAFKAKGYHYRFVLGKGLGHCDQQVQRATMGDALLWLWRGYPTGP
jgi:enterochelin esterase family protein